MLAELSIVAVWDGLAWLAYTRDRGVLDGFEFCKGVRGRKEMEVETVDASRPLFICLLVCFRDLSLLAIVLLGLPFSFDGILSHVVMFLVCLCHALLWLAYLGLGTFSCYSVRCCGLRPVPLNRPSRTVAHPKQYLNSAFVAFEARLRPIDRSP